MAGRQPLAPDWHEAGWQALIRSVSLRNLSPEESLSLLDRRQVPVAQRRSVLEFTHGHPLALSLVADVFAQREGFVFQPEQTPDIVKTLLEKFVQKVPGPAHRAALEACALVRVLTESLLAEMLVLPEATASGSQAVYELFEWLRSLSFVDARPGGIIHTIWPTIRSPLICAGGTPIGTPSCTAGRAPTTLAASVRQPANSNSGRCLTWYTCITTTRRFALFSSGRQAVAPCP